MTPFKEITKNFLFQPNNFFKHTKLYFKMHDKPFFSDPRSSNWFLIGSLVPIAAIMFFYLYLVLILLPNYMRNRRPHSFKTFMLFYNVFQILANSYYVYYVVISDWIIDYEDKCQSTPYNSSKVDMQVNIHLMKQ